ncbi:hypothetical protein SAMN05216503_3362 [Polaribacter sp. KT25b]|nr:hypothetical protein SAMN05216503_3362 [Polaribacter sp. KT25b]
MLYFVILPIIAVSIKTRIDNIILSVKNKNKEKTKAELIFLCFTIIIIFITISAIEYRT